MDLDTIGAALRRKLGPLPVWIWALFGGMVVYFLRGRGYFAGVLGDGTKSATALQPAQQSAKEPQQKTTLQPGESVYDPDTGVLSTAPGGGSVDGITGTTPTDNSDIVDAIQSLSDAVLGNHTDAVSASPTAPTAHKKTALQRAKAAVLTGKLGPKNRKRLEKAGYTDAQIDYHLRRHTALAKPRGSGAAQKGKAAHSQTHGNSAKSKTSTNNARQPGTHAPATNHQTTRARSQSHVRTAAGGKVRTPAKPAGKTTHSRTPSAPKQQTVRQRPKTAGVTRTTPVSHPQSAAHATAQAKTVAAHAATPAARAPSAPAPRAVRTPAPTKKKAPPPPKKKH